MPNNDKHILVIEDDEFLGNAYRVKLVKEGFQVELATNGEDALTSISTQKPDLILLDLVLPGKDGFQILSEIKANPKYNKIPVIVSSNLSQDEDKKRVLDLGAVDFIVKTDFALSALIDKIQQYLQT